MIKVTDKTILFRLEIIFTFNNYRLVTTESELIENKVISKVKQKQRSKWQVQHEPSKSGPVFVLKVVDSLAFDTRLFNKSSSIFLTNQF